MHIFQGTTKLLGVGVIFGCHGLTGGTEPPLLGEWPHCAFTASPHMLLVVYLIG
uniref:Uncharacterized protein n=1 Tax=Anguilla anguilla TaxID=7936 RepID=A0A0E9QXH9_ANGAN